MAVTAKEKDKNDALPSVLHLKRLKPRDHHNGVPAEGYNPFLLPNLVPYFHRHSPRSVISYFPAQPCSVLLFYSRAREAQ